MYELKFDFATKDDLKNIMDLLYDTEYYPNAEWGIGTSSDHKERIEYLFNSKFLNRFSPDNILVCKSNDEFVGFVLFLRGNKIKQLTVKSEILLLPHLNFIPRIKFVFLMLTYIIFYKECNADEFYISNISLDPKFRGLSLSQPIMDYCYKIALKDGFSKVALHANNESLVSFYKKLGFIISNFKDNKMTKNI